MIVYSGWSHAITPSGAKMIEETLSGAISAELVTG